MCETRVAGRGSAARGGARLPLSSQNAFDYEDRGEGGDDCELTAGNRLKAPQHESEPQISEVENEK